MGAEMIAEARLHQGRARRIRLSEPPARDCRDQGWRLQAEIVPVEPKRRRPSELHTADEGIRFDATLEGIAGVKLLSPDGGYITAASVEPDLRWRSGVLVVNERRLKALGVKPLARIHNMTVTAGDPVIMLEAPLPPPIALKKAGMKIDDIDLFEVNEAFASVPLAWLKHTGADPAAAQRQRRRHLAGPPAGRIGHQADDDAGACAEAPRQALRPADHV
jgi:acetyl-CoA C-acetyltransferase